MKLEQGKDRLIINIDEKCDSNQLKDFKNLYFKEEKKYKEVEVHYKSGVSPDYLMIQFLCVLFREIKNSKALIIESGNEYIVADFKKFGFCEVCTFFEIGDRCIKQ